MDLSLRERIVLSLEEWLTRNRPERQFELKPKQVLLLPGMSSYVGVLFPLVRYIRQHRSDFGATAIPLGFSMADFDSMVEIAFENISKNLLQKVQPKLVVLFGHSHGGRVACALANRIKKNYPDVEVRVIAAANAPVTRPDYFAWYRKYGHTFLSRAFREYPPVDQPDNSVVNSYVGLCSNADMIVIPAFAKRGFTGKMIDLEGFSHHDFVIPEKVGPVLLELLK